MQAERERERRASRRVPSWFVPFDTLLHGTDRGRYNCKVADMYDAVLNGIFSAHTLVKLSMQKAK